MISEQRERDLDLFDRQAAYEERVLKVRELAHLVKEVLEEGFPSIIVEGEISNFKRHMPSGHLYFTLKDEQAQVRSVMWRSDAARLKFDVADGMKVYVRGRISLYEPRGDLQLYASTITPAGQGALQLAFEQLKKKLDAEGLFEEGHKKPLPFLPARIGVVTSLEGAAVRDIISIVARRFPAVELLIYPVRVQGEGAAEEVAAAIRNLNLIRNVDVLIVGRGGGSLEDLWAFNEEIVARAIYDSRIPVISAVGHQVDFTISDFVADARAATPSAAAELVVPDRAEILDTLSGASGRMKKVVGQLLDQLKLQLDRLTSHYALKQPAYLVDQKLQYIDELTRRLDTHVLHYLDTTSQRLGAAEARLNTLSPRHVLGRGYAFVEGPGGLVSSIGKIEVGESATIHLKDGTLDTLVKDKYGQEQL